MPSCRPRLLLFVSVMYNKFRKPVTDLRCLGSVDRGMHDSGSLCPTQFSDLEAFQTFESYGFPVNSSKSYYRLALKCIQGTTVVDPCMQHLQLSLSEHTN